MNEVFVEFDIQKPYTRGSGMWEHRWSYMIFDAYSQGPIDWGYSDSKEDVLEKARSKRDEWQRYFDKEDLI